jgi:Sushi repeat (SCR repeat)
LVFKISDVDCGKISTVPNGALKYLNDTTFVFSEVEFSCVRNYRLVGGAPRRICKEDGSWSGTTPRCEGKV